MSEHTPTPWTAEKRGDRLQLFGSRVVMGCDWKEAVAKTNRTSEAATEQANAEFICLACNAHDELVKALQWVRRVVRHKSFCPAASGKGECDCGLGCVDAALAKAEAKP